MRLGAVGGVICLCIFGFVTRPDLSEFIDSTDFIRGSFEFESSRAHVGSLAALRPHRHELWDNGPSHEPSSAEAGPNPRLATAGPPVLLGCCRYAVSVHPKKTSQARGDGRGFPTALEYLLLILNSI